MATRKAYHVFGFEISVGNLVSVQLPQGQHHSRGVKARFLLRQLTRRLQKIKEFTSRKQLQYKIPAQMQKEKHFKRTK